jgi:hypothetical protein
MLITWQVEVILSMVRAFIFHVLEVILYIGIDRSMCSYFLCSGLSLKKKKKKKKKKIKKKKKKKKKKN